MKMNYVFSELSSLLKQSGDMQACIIATLRHAIRIGIEGERERILDILENDMKNYTGDRYQFIYNKIEDLIEEIKKETEE